MTRIRAQRFAPPIAATVDILGSLWDWLPPVRFVAGVDPLFMGLHGYGDTSYGSSYRTTAHTCYPWHLSALRSRRCVTVVLPEVETVETVIHELGHVADYRLGFDHIAVPVTRYAETNRREAFAEAWTSWLIPGYTMPVDDPSTRELLDELST